MVKKIATELLKQAIKPKPKPIFPGLKKKIKELKPKFQKLKPKKKWTKADDAFVIGSGVGVAATELFGRQGKARKTAEKMKKLTTRETVGTGDIGKIRDRRAGGGLAQRGLGKAFMKGGKV